MFDDSFRITSVAFFVTNFHLLSCESDNFILESSHINIGVVPPLIVHLNPDFSYCSSFVIS